MNYKVIPTPDFKKFFKKLFKKYPSLKEDLQKLIIILEENPNSGTHLGHNLYKIRMAISAKGKGKSSGARVITFLVTENKEVFFVHIYDKSQLENVSKQQLLNMLKNAGLM